MAGQQQVILRDCGGYGDARKLRAIISEGIEELKARPVGKILVKPNVVFAHRRYGTTGYTHPAVLSALMDVLAGMARVKEIVLGERCAVTIPTRYAFREAGYGPLAAKTKVRFAYFDEEKKREVHLRRATFHKTLRLARSILEADYKVYAPKLKHHVSTKLTCALKLNIGILDSDERLLGHDYRLEEKIADLVEVGNPDLIVVDAVSIGMQNELVPKPRHLGAIIMGTNPVAVDAVGARILGFDPREIKYLKMAHDRGWGPLALKDIRITGDVSPEELQERCGGIDRTFTDLLELDTPMHFHFGNYPGGEETCQTGCINMLKTCFAISEANAPGSLKAARPIAVVVGEYDGNVDGRGEKVILVGDCTKVSGTITGSVTRVGGCPVTVPYFMISYCRHAGVRSPYWDPSAMASFPFLAGLSYLSRLYHSVAG